MVETWVLTLASVAAVVVTVGPWWRMRRILANVPRVPGRVTRVTLEKTDIRAPRRRSIRM
jgi:hypothetical protein